MNTTPTHMTPVPPRGRRQFLVLLLAVLVTFGLAACGPGGSGATPEAPDEPVADPTITISDMEFVDGAVTVEVGSTVTWTWADAPTEHNVVFDHVESPLQAEGTWSHTFDEVGEFPYHCAPHPMMTGVVKVVAAS